MSKKPLILGIESSCDETAASIITENEYGTPIVLSNIISSQVDVHKEFGGVVPELAARSHMEKIDLIVKKAISDSGRKIEEIDAVASTAGPGLIVCLSVGLSFGKAFAASLNIPFIAVNHLEGHALSPKLNSNLNYPYLLLLISGGHSQFLNVQNLGKYKRLGTTIDDALGEAFDKTAKLLGIEFPGGPQIEILAKKGNPDRYDLPKPIINKGGCNLSFAGLKTAILKITKDIKSSKYGKSNNEFIFGLSACPSRWFTAIKGLFIIEAKVFAKLKPTDKHTISPGPAVQAIASISSIFFPLSLIAFWTTKSIFSIWDLAANSGTTPPKSLWISTWLDTIFDNIIGNPWLLSDIKEAAVSSQLDSIARIKGFLLIQIVFNNCTISIQVRNKFIYE